MKTAVSVSLSRLNSRFAFAMGRTLAVLASMTLTHVRRCLAKTTPRAVLLPEVFLHASVRLDTIRMTAAWPRRMRAILHLAATTALAVWLATPIMSVHATLGGLELIAALWLPSRRWDRRALEEISARLLVVRVGAELCCCC